MTELPVEAPTETPPTPPVPTSVTVTFSPDMGMHVATTPDMTSGHLWAAASYLHRIADQAMEDEHMGTIARIAREEREKVKAQMDLRSALIAPRDHLPPRRRS